MLVNTQWLMQYLEPGCSDGEIVDALPKVGLEVEEDHDLGQDLHAVRIGFIREKQQVPDADGIYLCRIEMDRGQLATALFGMSTPLRSHIQDHLAPFRFLANALAA